MPRDPEGCDRFGAESLSNSGRNSCPMARRTLGHRTAYRGYLLLNTKLMAIGGGVKGSCEDNAITGQKFRLFGGEIEPQKEEEPDFLDV